LEAKKYYFFSDVHLGLKSRAEEKAKEKNVVNFLKTITPDAKEIYIVGDLFDCWIEYRKVVPKGYYNLLSAINNIVESGIPVHFLSGNHDFWLNTYLRDDVGMTIHYDPVELMIDNRKFFIAHGDGLSKGDTGYKIIKKILRSKFNQFLYSLIHPDIGITLAQGSSRSSRKHTDKPYGASDGMKEFAIKKISEGFDFVIMGHYHMPQKIELKENNHSGYFITLGDWINNYTYGTYSDGAFELEYWNKT